MDSDQYNKLRAKLKKHQHNNQYIDQHLFSDTDIYIKADHSVKASAKLAKTSLEGKYKCKMDWGKLRTKMIQTIQDRISSKLQKMLTKQGSIFDKGEGSRSDGEEE